MTIILVLPIILSIMVLFNEKPCATYKKVSEERNGEAEPKSDFKQQEQEYMSEKVAEEHKPDDMTNKAADAAGEESTQSDEPSEEKRNNTKTKTANKPLSFCILKYLIIFTKLRKK